MAMERHAQRRDVGVMGGVNRFRNETIDGTDLDNGREGQMSGRFDARHQLTGARSRRRQRSRRPRTSRAGGNVRSARRPTAVVNDYSGDATRVGAYGSVRWTIAPTLTLLPGVRVDHTTLTDDTVTSPWLQAVWRLMPVR